MTAEWESSCRPLTRQSGFNARHRTAQLRHRGPLHVFESVSGCISSALPGVRAGRIRVRIQAQASYHQRSRRLGAVLLLAKCGHLDNLA